MPSEVINLSTEPGAFEHRSKLPSKQEMNIRLGRYYSRQTRLIRALKFHKLAHENSMRDYIDITKRIELQEEKLLRD